MQGTIPKIFRLCVCVLINKRSFQSFVCFDLVRIHSQYSLHQLLHVYPLLYFLLLLLSVSLLTPEEDSLSKALCID